MFVPIVDGGVRAKGIRVNVREDDFFLTMTPFLSYIGVIYLKYLYQFLFVSALKAFSLFLPPVRSFPPEKLRESIKTGLGSRSRSRSRSEPGVFGSLEPEPEPLEKKTRSRSRSRLEKKVRSRSQSR